MSERIVSPGVFTREKDLSFLPQGISDIGAAIIGPTSSGPAFVPTIVNNFSEFESLFGKLNTNYYTPYTIKEYLKSAGTVTVVRILGIGGYTNDFISVNLSGSCSSGPQSGSLVHGTAFVLKEPDKRWHDVKIKEPKEQDKRVSMKAKDIKLPGGIPNNMNI